MFKISLLCPTRKRVSGLKRMWDSALNTADNPEYIELVIYVDHDDQETLDFLSINKTEQFKIIHEDLYKKEIYSNLHNICCEHASADIVFGCADDLIFRTNGWDSIVLSKFKDYDDGLIFAYPNDGYWGEKFGTHGFFHKNWFNVLGYLSPPIFTVGYSDNYINDIAKAIDRFIYLDNILIEHMHWTFGKMEMDTTAKEAHHRRSTTNNDAIYRSFETIQKQREDIDKLRSAMRV